MYQLLDTVPDDKIPYIIGYIQGLTIERNEKPNKETIAAFAEADEMKCISSGGSVKKFVSLVKNNSFLVRIRI